MSTSGSERTATLVVGQRLEIALEGAYDWTASVDNQRSLQPLFGGVGATRLYEAIAPGTTKITLDGDPVCRKAKPPCGAPSRSIEITVVVR